MTTRRILVTAAILAVAAVVVATAFGKTSTKPIVRATHNDAQKKTIVVDAKGLTLYRLSPETGKHLLCKSSACVSFWPPLTVGSRSAKLVAGSGVHGKLGLIRRGYRYQVTLGGKPLYRYSGDSGKGKVNGEGVVSFGGTWHTVAAGAAASPSPNTTTNPGSTTTETTPTTTQTTPTYPSYGY
jgi:predicted lipoprotein with Yx(FWY)xxD motif